MKNTFGNSLTVTLFGESHGEAIGAVIDGIAPGIGIDEDFIAERLDLRKPYGKISTARHEDDKVKFLSGIYNGHTTGTPIALIIPNSNTSSKDYTELLYKPRPSHADLSAQYKYHGFQDFRGGGHFSGRITAALVAAGALIEQALIKKNIKIGSHISYLCGIRDRDIMNECDIDLLNKKKFPTLSEDAEEKMQKKIEAAASDGDSVGGILEGVIYGMPRGVGEPWFDSMESAISHILFSIPAIKGVEFGLGFGFADVMGSEANDAFILDCGSVKTSTNNNGGINGGITNGMPIVVRCAVKPTPSIYKEQGTVDLRDMQNTTLTIKGRHDPAIIHRARAVVNAALAIAVADMLCVRFGTDYLVSED